MSDASRRAVAVMMGEVARAEGSAGGEGTNKHAVTRLLKADDSALFFCAEFPTAFFRPCEKPVHMLVPRSNKIKKSSHLPVQSPRDFSWPGGESAA